MSTLSGAGQAPNVKMARESPLLASWRRPLWIDSARDLAVDPRHRALHTGQTTIAASLLERVSNPLGILQIVRQQRPAQNFKQSFPVRSVHR